MEVKGNKIIIDKSELDSLSHHIIDRYEQVCREKGKLMAIIAQKTEWSFIKVINRNNVILN